MTISGVNGFSENDSSSVVGSNEVDPSDVDLSDLQEVINRNEEISANQDIKAKSRSISLIAGATIMALAITVAVVALSVLSAGIPQSILLGIALSTLVVGSITTIQTGMEIIHNKVKERCHVDEKWRLAAHSLSLGAGLTSLGFALKFGGSFIPGYGSVLGNVGSTAFTMGSNSTFNSLCYLLYMRFAASEKVLKAQPLTEQERMRENKKFAILATAVLATGVGAMLLGITLTVAGSVLLAGVPASVALIFAPPLLSIGVGLSLRALLKGEITKWKEYFKQSSYDLLEAQALSDSSEEEGVYKKAEMFLEVTDNRPQTAPSQNRKQSVSSSTGSSSDSHTSSTHTQRNRFSSVDKTETVASPLLSTKEKVSLALGSLLLISAMTLLLMSGVGGLAAYQILIMSVVGSSILGTAFGNVFSGLFTVAGRLKNRNREGRSLREAAKEKMRSMTGRKGHYKVKQVDIDSMVASDINQSKKEKVINLFLVGGITFLLGVSIAMLSLIPGVGAFSAALISIAGPFLITGGLVLVKKLVEWLNHQLYVYRKRSRERKERIRIATAALGVEPQDVYVDVQATQWTEDFHSEGHRKNFPSIDWRSLSTESASAGFFGIAPFGLGGRKRSPSVPDTSDTESKD